MILFNAAAAAMRDRTRIAAALLPVGGYTAWFVMLFSPILFFGKLFPSDGMLASFYSPIELWNDLSFGGAPGIGDPQLAQLYPLRLLTSLLPGDVAFNAYVLLSYVIASSLMYGYAWNITRSRLAAAIGGLVYGTSGFLIAHVGHTGLLTASAWAPLVFWSLEELRRRFAVGWFLCAVFAVTTIIVAGHPQASVYTVYCAAAYVACLGRWSAYGWVRFVALFVAIMAFGVALAAPQLLPTLELTRLSLRSELTFDAFKQYALPPKQSISLLFPYLFGGGSSGAPAHFGQWSFAESTGYVGLPAVLLAALGVLSHRREPLVIFWAFAAVVAFLLALGDATPLIDVTFHLPAIDKLRAPARHFLEMTLAVSVLSSLGVHAVQRGIISRRLVNRVLAVAAAIMVAALALISWRYPSLEAAALAKGVTIPMLLANAAVWTPPALLAVSACVLLYWVRNPSKPAVQALVLAMVAADLFTFSRFAEWGAGPEAKILEPPGFLTRYRALLAEGGQRFATMNGWQEPVTALSTMFTPLYHLRNVSGYGPMIVRRYAEMSRVTNGGWVNPSVLSPADRTLDLLAARYLVVSTGNGALVQQQGYSWRSDDLGVRLGSGCGRSDATTVRVSLPRPVNVERLAIVSRMACSRALEQSQPVLKIAMRNRANEQVEYVMRAGQHTAEWAVDCADVQPLMRHGAAPVFDSWENARAGMPTCQGHRYLGALDGGVQQVHEIEIEWLAPAPSVIDISKISLIDDRSESYAIAPSDVVLANSRRFRKVESIGTSSIYENLRAMPRTWLVSKVVSADPAVILNALVTSMMPDGSAFDPAVTAFVEDQIELVGTSSTADSAVVVSESGDRIRIETRAAEPAFLVLSEIDYPDWHATVDGRSVPVVRTNYTLRGVSVPAGMHDVVFEYRPMSLYAGAIVAAAAALALLTFAVVYQRRARAIQPA